jgi:Mu-like prophage I protein/Caudovirus prohead serine protease
VDVVASTPAVDSWGRVVVQDWDLARFNANPIVLWNHGFGSYGNENCSLPIGFAENVRVEDGNLKATLCFVDEAANPIAEKVYQGFLQGSLRAVSVGWECDEPSFDSEAEVIVCRGNRLIEISAVSIPANPEAVREAASWSADLRAATQHGKGIDMSLSAIKRALELAPDATEAEMLERINQNASQLAAWNGLASVAGVTTATEAHGLFVTIKAGFEQGKAAIAELEQLKEKARENEVALLVKQARDEGKFTPANEAEILRIAGGNIDTLKSLIAVLPVSANRVATETPQKGAASVLSESERAKCKAEGWDPDEYAAMKRRVMGISPEGDLR